MKKLENNKDKPIDITKCINSSPKYRKKNSRNDRKKMYKNQNLHHDKINKK